MFLTKRNLNSPCSESNHSKFKPQGLSKAERLSSKDKIDDLFNLGKKAKSKNIKLIYQIEQKQEKHALHQGIFSAPKKQFPKAVDRNKRKRHLREAYRLGKHILYEQFDTKNKICTFIFIYLGKEIIPFDELQKEINSLLKTMANAC